MSESCFIFNVYDSPPAGKNRVERLSHNKLHHFSNKMDLKKRKEKFNN